MTIPNFADSFGNPTSDDSNEKLVFHIGEQVQELKKLVQVNKNTLVILKGSLDAPEEMKKLTSQLTDVQTLLQVRTKYHYIKLLFE